VCVCICVILELSKTSVVGVRVRENEMVNNLSLRGKKEPLCCATTSCCGNH